MDRDDLLPRGVYRPRYRDEYGRVLLLAIDRRGWRVREEPVPPGADVRAVVAVLERLLDQVDPPDPAS